MLSPVVKPLSLAIAFALCQTPSIAYASSPENQAIEIKQQSLATSLNEVAQHFDRVISFKPQLVANKHADALSGALSFEQALASLLTPHNLAFGKSGNSYFIYDKQKAVSLPDVKVVATEHITIHGQKANRSLSETLAAIDVVTEDDLHGGKYFSLVEVLNESINLTPIAGAAPAIRGVDTNGSTGSFSTFTSGSKPRMTNQIDGIDQPTGPVWSGEIGLWDIEQVEVYRGPQSTLGGRNSIAGLVFVKTADPTFDWQGKTRLGYRSNDGYYEAAGAISGPIVEDQVAFRVAAQVVDGDTATKYTLDEYPFDPNKVFNKNLRAKLLFQPSGFEQFHALYSYNESDERGSLNFMYDGPDLTLRQKELGAQQKNDTATHALTLSYDISEQLTARAIVSRQDYLYQSLVIPDNYAVEIQEESDTFDGQLIYSNANGRVEHAIFGLYHYKRKQKFQSWNVGKTFYIGDDDTQSNAVYAETTLVVNSDVKITAGGRYLREEQFRDFDLDAWTVHYEIDKSDTLFLPQLAINWQLNDELSLGLSAKQGYNPGGGNFNRYTMQHYYFEPETVDAYEFTARANLTDDIKLVSHVFYNSYDDYQHEAFGESGHWQDIEITNLDQVTTYGVELAFDMAIGAHWQWQVDLGWLDSDVEQSDAVNKAIDGKQLSYAAKQTARSRLSYWFNEASYIQWQLRYTGEHFSTLENTEKSLLNGHAISSINAGFEIEQWMFNLYVNNLADKEVITGQRFKYLEPNVIQNGHLTQERTFGLSATYHFE